MWETGTYEMSEWTRSNIRWFVDIVKEHPTIWKADDPNYKLKSKRDATWKLVNDTMRNAGVGNFVVEDLKKKWNTLRGQYRRELKIMRDAQLSGAQQIDVPKLWSFDLLTFISEGEAITPPAISVENFSVNNIHEGSDDMFHTVKEETISIGLSPSPERSPTPTTVPPPPALPKVIHPKKKKKLDSSDELLLAAVNQLRALEDTKETNDEFDIYGQMVATQIRKMTPVQQCIAQKIINETLYYGKMEDLTKSASITFN